MKKIKVGIVGGAGYTGGELIRILLHHPGVELVFVHSKSHDGQFLHKTHSDLLAYTQMKFSQQLSEDIDVLFLCLGHGDSYQFLNEHHFPDSLKLIDLSQDFRIKGSQRYDFQYGLPELHKHSIQEANKIANPGCFATCIQLALLPLAKAKCLKDDIHISAITGSTGAGQSPTATTHFSWRNNNISVYKAFTHQHLQEIYQSIQCLQATFTQNIHFIPYRGNFSRGILASVYLKSTLSKQEAVNLYRQYYEFHPFVYLSSQNPDVKQVVNTNHCFLYLEKHQDTLLIISTIDNLVKGASGQAVQNMNLMFGLQEHSGLQLKPVAF